MPPGHYCHLGLEHQLRNALALALADAATGGSITLQFSFDGLPISKSSRKELWPIQCRILEHHDAVPFVIGVWAGAAKPDSAEEYLAQFLTELKQLMRNGISFDGRVTKSLCTASSVTHRLGPLCTASSLTWPTLGVPSAELKGTT
ncbi:hypothetical protein HPB48_010259 [Haemaphysalis longicornis]|uniref:Uncharacterized protein n=1 Tax=Haemaphysalis longicornis TaxID=44386 RepID=A0A9J6GRH9_HAELO|nr:hypothetical protein HPB48_010259 [Haemaphysalis longicornis]